jgi:nicotinate-nucleotide pyrophosphorylase
MIMFKDNRIISNFVIHLIYLVVASHGRSTRSITAAIGRTQSGWVAFALRLDVEVDEDEVNVTIAADVVLLNNIEGSELTSVACR